MITKGVKFLFDMLFDPRPQIVGEFHLLFWTHGHFNKTKASKRKICTVCGYKIESKNSIWKVFLIRDPQIVGGFICYFDLWPCHQAESWKTQNTVFCYKKESKIQCDKIFWSTTPILWKVKNPLFWSTFRRNFLGMHL